MAFKNGNVYRHSNNLFIVNEYDTDDGIEYSWLPITSNYPPRGSGGYRTKNTVESAFTEKDCVGNIFDLGDALIKLLQQNEEGK